MYTICILGASTGWIPGLVTDLMAVFPERLEIRLIDIDPRNAELCREWGEAATRFHGRKDRFAAFTDRRAALRDADAVLITLSTGGLDAMERDIAITEKYGIFATVGDTAGPGGWSRAIRNIPVFMEFARDFQEICPKAFIANYTNPMSALTATLDELCGNPVVGLCHAYFETKDVIQRIFELPDWSRISISIAGMNHFTWVVDFRIGKDDGYALLRKKVGKEGSLADVLPAHSKDEAGFFSGHLLCVELYDAFGFLPYPADRHTSEFVSFVLAGHPKLHRVTTRDGAALEATDFCSVKRTSIAYRRELMAAREQTIREKINGMGAASGTEPPTRSRETGAEMIAAFLKNAPFIDAVNCLNSGQIPELPPGSCVETLGMVDGLGVRPLFIHGIPGHLLEIMRPQAVCQKWITEGVIKGNRDLLMQALYHDPLCAALPPREIRLMAEELFEANRRYPGALGARR